MNHISDLQLDTCNVMDKTFNYLVFWLTYWHTRSLCKFFCLSASQVKKSTLLSKRSLSSIKISISKSCKKVPVFPCRRDRTLNYFSVMVKKRLKNETEDADDPETKEKTKKTKKSKGKDFVRGSLVFKINYRWEGVVWVGSS